MAVVPSNQVAPTDGRDYFGVNKVKPKSELNTETFIRLLTVQLANQNPLEPMSDTDFFAQLAQLGTVEGLGNIEQSMEMTQATQLIGKSVVALRPASETSGGFNSFVAGTVERVSIKNGEIVLRVKEASGYAEIKPGAILDVVDTPAKTSSET